MATGWRHLFGAWDSAALDAVGVLGIVAEDVEPSGGVAGPRGFEPRTTGSAGRRPILARLRAHLLYGTRVVYPWQSRLRLYM